MTALERTRARCDAQRERQIERVHEWTRRNDPVGFAAFADLTAHLLVYAALRLSSAAGRIHAWAQRQ